MPLGRRAFLATVGASLAAPRLLRARARSKRYPIAFSTLGCPAWSFKSILDQADRLGYSAIEPERWMSRVITPAAAASSRDTAPGGPPAAAP